MPYFLYKAVLARAPRIPIEREEYESLIAAWTCLRMVVAIEEEWDSVIQNYLDLEHDLLRTAVHSMVLNHESYDEFQDLRLGFARKLSNLLHSCRSYVDHTSGYLNDISGSNLNETFSILTKKAYDANFSYRFMQALRNYAQHSGLPLHGATFDTTWTGNFENGSKNKGSLRHTVAASIDINKIKQDPQFKRSIIAEIGSHLNQLDVSILTREYIEALAGVHNGLRTAFHPLLINSKTSIDAAIAKYAKANKGDTIGLSVGLFESDTVISNTNLFDELPLRIEKLMRRNGHLTNLRLRYVTSEITPQRAEKRVPEKGS